MRKSIPSWLRIIIAFFIICLAAEWFIDSGNKPAFLEYPLLALFLVLILFILIATEAIVSSLDNILYQSLSEAEKAKYHANNKKESKFLIW